ncbi:hypothetical protein [Streptococcus suis]|uniref:hypothetical protein n=1 Tax=Streptococcus suis TaxID=1307 RepID=UPI00195FFFF9|nr:hypothetical protein [Streptococcus suis]MBM7283748.1 hypothetical protein [Streptococcus suis]MBO3642030.1 hypothetical protein [Streptococcus suis]MCO8236655.1 hypothetical protein [Streptococcus suis]HEM3505927.1 hypothetical protein [Streptococcus suis]HEM3533526.1 hypothetical protein [Streptococcus suis]
MSTFKLGAVTLLAGLALFGGATAQAETFTAVSSEATGFKTSDPCRFDGEAVETKNSWGNYTFINHYRPGGRGSEGEVNNELAKQIENGDFTLQHSPATGFKTSDPYRFEGEEVETKNSWGNYTFINHYRPGGRGSEGEVNNELAKQIENGDFTLQHSPAGGFKTSDPCLVDEYGFGQIKIL